MRRKLAGSRVSAQRAILEGLVQVDGVPSPKPATLIDAAQTVRLLSPPEQFVSRGGRKLDAALEAFSIDVESRRAIDVGASTGGFTDCLLQRGAASVVAIDVGYGQLDWRLRSDPRVTVVERTNIRDADPGTLGAPFDIVVADLSFISLSTVAPHLVALGTTGTDFVLLVKPQFELGKGRIGKGGIVRDPSDRLEAMSSAVGALATVGLGLHGAVPSPIEGAKGNREFLIWMRPGAAIAGGDALSRAARSEETP